MINNFESFFYQFYSTIENGKSAFDQAMQGNQNTIEKTQLLQQHFLQVQEDLNQLLDIKAKVELLSIDELCKQECPMDSQDETMRYIQHMSFIEFAEQQKNELLSQIQLVSQHTVQWLNDSHKAAGLSPQKSPPSFSNQIVNILTLPFQIFQHSINYLWPFNPSSITVTVSHAKTDFPSFPLPLPLPISKIDSSDAIATHINTPLQNEVVNQPNVQAEPQPNMTNPELNREATAATISALPESDANHPSSLKERVTHRTPPTLPPRTYKKSTAEQVTRRTPPPIPPRTYMKASIELNPALNNQENKEPVQCAANSPIPQLLMPIQNPPVDQVLNEENKIEENTSKDLEATIASPLNNEAKIEQLEAAHKTDSLVKSTNAFIPEPPALTNAASSTSSPTKEDDLLTSFLAKSLILRRSYMVDEEPESPLTSLSSTTTTSFDDLDMDPVSPVNAPIGLSHKNMGENRGNLLDSIVKFNKNQLNNTAAEEKVEKGMHPLHSAQTFQTSDSTDQKPSLEARGNLLDSIVNFNKNGLKKAAVAEKVEDKSSFISQLEQSMNNLGVLNIPIDVDSDSDFDSEEW